MLEHLSHQHDVAPRQVVGDRIAYDEFDAGMPALVLGDDEVDDVAADIASGARHKPAADVKITAADVDDGRSAELAEETAHSF
ncbi:MAG: hypothetical protein E7A86_34455, partial [Bradyrhizobium sp.]|nr:hypothetical protein [Bradyrhizobium sp.]